ncbi:hypothetical protein [uncultured Tenacibaculum sp.]|uniref:hypothetical protein n=1 Tax=uncultured Tenacibaculum sp. TaxID=174713 RepID=UPI0026388998|nr:hypothetical protein [uncultured Tenacibaculum sp.]
MKLRLYIIIYFILHGVYSQNRISFDRLQAIENRDLVFYNIDGIRITRQDFPYSFNQKGLKKVYKKYRIRKKEIRKTDTIIKYNHVLITSEQKFNEKLILKNSIYFVENKKKQISVIFFSAHLRDTKLEQEFIPLALENKIPQDRFARPELGIADFSGRQIKLGGNCGWKDINSIQCPGRGQMNWSTHKDLENAKKAIDFQLTTTKYKKVKIISEEEVNVEFEGTPTKAIKVKYNFIGGRPFFFTPSKNETLIVYYVACKVRGNYMSCVLSHWESDPIGSNGLPSFLEEVMKIK